MPELLQCSAVVAVKKDNIGQKTTQRVLEQNMSRPVVWHNFINTVSWCTLILLAATVISLELGAAQPKDYANIKGPNACAECHEKSADIWQKSRHFLTFSRMPRSKEGREISDRMGIKRIKADSLCLDCHFTSQETPERTVTIAGISCESCHSASANWLERHSEFSGKKESEETESEIKKRWADAEAAGMIRPHMIYTLAKNCYSCHITPNEELVNRGRHSPGSPFELLSWSQGEIRHSVWNNESKSNLEASAEHKRMLFIVGAAVELEESLRALGAATVKAKYAAVMGERAQLSARRMAAIAKLVPVHELTEIVALLSSVKLSLNNGLALSTVADQIGSHARQFSGSYDGSDFTAVDQVLPSAETYKGTGTP